MKGFIIMSFIVCCTGCTSMAELRLIEKGGQVLDGSVFAEKKLAVYQLLAAGKENRALELKQVKAKRNARESLVITMEAFPFFQFRGDAPDHEGGFLFQSVHFLGGSLSGWNEFVLDISGAGVFAVQGNKGAWQIKTPIEPVQISGGKILHNGNRITGEQALVTLRNRYERIGVLTKWMHTQDVPEIETQEAFEAYWKPLLLPELVAAKNRPETFIKDNAVWVQAEDVKWNTTYTASFFPEELWILRNSGSLLRDWEEACAWIYFQYQWDYIIGLISEKYTLKKIK